jgi:hypothetical protein
VPTEKIRELQGFMDQDVIARLGNPKHKTVIDRVGSQEELWTYDGEILDPRTNRPYQTLQLTFVNRRVTRITLTERP